MELGALSKLIKMTKSESVEEVIKALFAISALIRNNLVGQELFYSEAGDFMIQVIIAECIYASFVNLSSQLLRVTCPKSMLSLLSGYFEQIKC